MAFQLGIGELSRQTGCNIETIRYYEREGLMPDPPRTQGGHRLYDKDHLKRLTFIRRSRQLGFTLEEVRELLSMVDGGNYTCADIKTVTLGHLKDIKSKIADLRKLEQALNELAKRCTGDKTPDCAIVDTLFEGSSSASAGKP